MNELLHDRVRLQISGGIAQVTLSRPDKVNALDAGMFAGAFEAQARLASRKDVRVVILAGEGRGFCSGLDFPAFMANQMGPESEKIDIFGRIAGNPANVAQRMGYGWRALPMPVIAALHGPVFGGGIQIALGADIRLAAPDTRLSVMEIKWGLIPDMSITQTLREVVRGDVARELTYTGRIVEAPEALALGLVTRVVDQVQAAALELATTIAGKSPDAIRAAKQLYNESWYAPAGEGMQLEEKLQRQILGQANQMEAVAANFEKRSPVFSD